MRVILLEDIKGNGKKGDIIEVKDGYARNYLFPKKLASEATQAKEQAIRARQEKERRQQQEDLKQMKAYAAQLNGQKVVLRAHAGEEGRLFGAITNADVADVLKEQGWDVDRKKIELPQAIRHLGEYEADLHLYPAVECKITVKVLAQ
ncbi:MAG: 50S ribosomal protein L9, partial [Firmicutes bacterium]|nr:50S ribosomal protein L9 [Bacillota bacterium]